LTPKRAVKPIEVDKEKLEDLNAILSSSKIGPTTKRTKQKHLIGECCICLGIPTKLVTYDMDGASKIERYCDKCFEKWDK
jgi:hypothetical protein